MEIRKVKHSDRGLILWSTKSRQKIHMVTRDSHVSVGDFVVATVLRANKNYALYHCTRIPDERMIVELAIPRGASRFATYHWKGANESAGYFDTTGMEPFVEAATDYDGSYWGPGETLGVNRVVLIYSGSEEKARGIFVKSQFRHFVLEDLGVWNLHANGGADFRGCESFFDFLQVWRQYKHPKSFERIVGVKNPMDLVETNRSEWHVLFGHLAAWSLFARSIKNTGMCIGSEGPEQLRCYGFTMTPGANAYACLNPLLDRVERFFYAPSDITRKKVFQFLAQNKSVFPAVTVSSI